METSVVGSALTTSVAAVIVAGGTGERFGDPGGKQLASAAGEPVLARTIDAFTACDLISEIIVAVHPDRISEFQGALRSSGVAMDSILVIAGGETRQQSVANGLAAIKGAHRIVAVHDGARPVVSADLIERAIHAIESKQCDGVVVGHPSFDTLKLVDDDRIVDTPDRSRYWVVQTPQVFLVDVLRAAHAAAVTDGYQGTDDASLVERNGGDVRVLEGPRENIKVTVPADLGFVEAILRSREDQE